MDDQKTKDAFGPDGLSREKFDVGFDANPPTVMLISIPLAKLVDDDENGKAILIGKLEGLKQRALSMINMLRERKRAGGLIKPADLRGPTEVIQ